MGRTDVKGIEWCGKMIYSLSPDYLRAVYIGVDVDDRQVRSRRGKAMNANSLVYATERTATREIAS